MKKEFKNFEKKLEEIIAGKEFTPEQIEEIRNGLEQELNVSKYANPEFDEGQMYQIRLGLEQRLDVSKYADPKFDWRQMEEIREEESRKLAYRFFRP